MSDYTHLNLGEVEDQAPKFGFAPDLESRFARTPLGLERSGVSLFRLAPGFRMPFGHRHAEQEEVYVLVSGAARAKVGDDDVDMRPLDALRVSPTAVRCFEAGAEGAEILAFGAPQTEQQDAEMLPGWWGG